MNAQTVGDFFIALAFVGAVTGFLGGAAAAWRGWPPLRTFAGVAALVAAAALLFDLPGQLGPRDLTLAVIGAPLVGLFPAGAGFVVARQLLRHR